MVTTASLTPIAEALKLFGNNLTVIVKFRPDAPTFFKETEPVFAIMDGIPVPFFIASLQLRGSDRACILFDSIYCESQARELVGKTLYQVAPKRIKSNQPPKDPNLLVGFTATDAQQGVLGEVEAFMDWRLNPCLRIRRAHSVHNTHTPETFLVPFHEAFISSIDFKAKHITLSLPQGLLEINSQSLVK